ncbi:MAG: PilC/PilY family type IV pilus protein [Gammaproteobacteria bacterium]
MPKKADGSQYTTSFTAAYKDGFDTNQGSVDLSSSYQPTASLALNGGNATHLFMGHFASDSQCSATTPRMCQLSNGSGGWITTITACSSSTSAATRNTSCRGGTPAPGPAYYYVFDSALASCTNSSTDNNCYKIKIVSATSGPGTIDLNGNGTVGDAGDKDERQNFANWYSFARTRNLATMTGSSIAFANLAPTVRVAWQALNSCRASTTSLVTSSCAGWKGTPTVSNAIKPFTGSHKADFYSWLTQLPTANSTPLPQSMTRVGEYYKTTGENSPYDNDYTTSSSGEYACRRNYHIMMTDGLWNTSLTVGNQDNSTIPLPAAAQGTSPLITQYAPIAPYKDAYPDTLADVAFKYWITDLRPTLNNNLFPIYNDRTGTANQSYWNPRNDPATWQHMVNFTIGLGLSPTLANANPALTWGGDTYSGSYPAIAAGGIAWPQAFSSAVNAGNVADLWHAAINSRGQFFAADDPIALGASFQQILTAISGDQGSAASLSTNSATLQLGTTVVYQAKFNRDWSGALLALPIDENGTVGAQIWDASKLIPAYSARRIFTFNDTTKLGVKFNSCANLSPAERDYLNRDSLGNLDNRCADRLSWLLGNPAKEQRNGGTFRNRPTTVMGDVINSDPAYVQNIGYGYEKLPVGTPGQTSYKSYVDGNATRMPMIYVGANDGRLYGIRADQGNAQSGVEQFSYIPSGVYSNLTYLTDPAYSHHYYVDGAVTASDAYIAGQWKTVVLGGLNAGGKTVYALDVTDPSNFSESKVMWEFTDVDMGLSFSQPQVGILQNGQWVAVFGNGYNSTNGGAYLYVVDLETGTLLAKIKASDETATDETNGLSTPVLFSSDGDSLIDTVYAGDLKGNMWKFDLQAPSKLSWGLAYGAPLFQARGPSGNLQPITSQPNVGGHTQGGFIVVFGTGQYLTGADVNDLSVQTYYGIWDNGAPVTSTNRSELQVQTIDLQKAAFGREVRSITGNVPDWASKKGWYLDLLDPPTPPGTRLGERVVSSSLILGSRVIFVTLVPSTDPCSPGGTSWLMELDLQTGGTFASSILDLNNDNLFNDFDMVDSQVLSGERQSSLGISKRPALIQVVNNTGVVQKVLKELTGSSDGFDAIKNKPEGGPPVPPTEVKRRSWIQIR